MRIANDNILNRQRAQTTPTSTATVTAPSPFAGLVSLSSAGTAATGNPFGVAKPAGQPQPSPPKPTGGATVDLFF